MMVNMDECPRDPLHAIMWLSGVKDAVDREVSAAYQKAYFEARRTGRLDAALALGVHSRKRVMAFTRAENERTGRQWRWGDGRG